MTQLKRTLAASLVNLMLLMGAVFDTESRAQTAAQSEALRASSLIWKTRCAVRKESRDDRPTLYCLNSPRPRGYPVSEEMKSLVDKWLVEHPNAYVLPIYSSPMFLDNPTGTIQVYAWVVDGDSNLNIYLVRMGACPAEMMKLESGDKPAINEGAYEAFLKQIAQAERDAKTERLGIWRNHAP